MGGLAILIRGAGPPSVLCLYTVFCFPAELSAHVVWLILTLPFELP